jgi:ubiquinone/menaquinone biosynthesis C-methylase UbiE
VASRVEDVKVGDMRKLPFGDGVFEAAVSTYAVDHIPQADQPVAIAEIARVLKPHGELLLGIVNQDFWVRLSMPIPHFGLAAHHAQDPKRWHEMLTNGGFEVIEEGTFPATLYWVARKSS